MFNNVANLSYEEQIEWATVLSMVNAEDSTSSLPSSSSFVTNVEKFCKNVKKRGIGGKLSDVRIHEIAVFMENEFPKLINNKINYVTYHELAFEYDPITKHKFVHLNDEIGRGYVKKATYSIVYDPNNPRPCINLTTRLERDGNILNPAELTANDAQFRRELAILETMKGAKHVAQVITNVVRDQRIFSFQEFYHKGSLSDLMNKEILTAEQKLKVARGVVEGLAALHESGFLHRDLHPGNVLVDQHYNGYVTDLGLTRHQVEIASGEQAQSMKNYIAPELFSPEGKSSQDYKNGEIYTAGLNLYKMVYLKDLEIKNQAHKVFKHHGKKKHKKKHIANITGEINARRDELEQKINSTGEDSLSTQEALEFATLEMVHQNVERRKSLAFWKGFFDRTLTRVNKSKHSSSSSKSEGAKKVAIKRSR